MIYKFYLADTDLLLTILCNNSKYVECMFQQGC